MRAGERRSDVESELASDDPTELDDMVFSDEEESREVVVTSVERCGPTTMSAGGEQDAARHCRTQFCKAKPSTHICVPRMSKHTHISEIAIVSK